MIKKCYNLCILIQFRIAACIASFAAAHAASLRRLSHAMMLGGVLILIDAQFNMAFAASGLARLFAAWKDDFIIPGVELAKYAFYGTGVVTTGVGINKLIQVSKPNTNVTPIEAGGYTLGGGGLMGVGYIAGLAQDSMTAGNSTHLITN